jgi:hypothetical protein
MAPTAREAGGSSRRKSVNLFSRSSLSQLNTDGVHGEAEDGVNKDRKKLGKRGSIFSLGSGTSPDQYQDVSTSPVERSNSPKIRPRTLQKGRPSSLFGSIGKRSMTYVDEGEVETLNSATPESPEEGQMDLGVSTSRVVLHHGEVQTTSGMFRKKKEYLVLTETHLIRFKSQSRASETFPSIPPAHGRSGSTRHPSTTSVGSLQEVQSIHSHSSAEFDQRIPLCQIVTAYKVEDGKPFFTTEVVYLDEEFHGVGSIQLILHDPKEADLWHTSIKAAAQKTRLLMHEPYPQRVIRYLVQILEAADDYDANHFQVFRVVRRVAVPKGGRSSSDDLQKLGALVFYMVVGINRLHMIPIPDFSDPSGRLVKPKLNRSIFGLVTLATVNVSFSDDRFEIGFRLPLEPVKLLELAASATNDIATVIFRACQYLKPQWLDFTFTFGGPKRLLDTADIPYKANEEEYGCFDRTLIAYCMAYNVRIPPFLECLKKLTNLQCNPANIQYAVDWEVEDAPEFRLFPPAKTKKYSTYELLAIVRALRYNESFHSISFKNIDLHSMHTIHDNHGADHVAWSTRAGMSYGLH